MAGAYQAWALDAAGIAASQMQRLQAQLTATKAVLETAAGGGLTKDDFLGDVLYTAALYYFTTTDIADGLPARAVGVLAYRQPSFGRVTAVVRPHCWFGVPRTVVFPGLEIDVDHLVSSVVSQDNARATQRAYVQVSGLRQSALEHQILEQCLPAPLAAGDAVSAVKALTVASRQGQRLYTITSDTMASALPYLTLAPEVTMEIHAAVAMGKSVLVSQRAVTVGGWTGVGYIILDPETGSGAYTISGGANGGFSLVHLLANTLMVLSFVPAITVVFVGLLTLMFGPFAALGITILSERSSSSWRLINYLPMIEHAVFLSIWLLASSGLGSPPS